MLILGPVDYVSVKALEIDRTETYITYKSIIEFISYVNAMVYLLYRVRYYCVVCLSTAS